MLSTKRFAAALMLALAGTAASAAEDCRCPAPAASMDQALDASAYVFRAVVVGAEVNRTSDGFATDLYLGEVIPLKGGKPPFYKLHAPVPEACGLRAEVPQEYWFFTDARGELAPCSRSGPAAAVEFAALENQVRALVAQSRSGDYDAGGYGRRPSGLSSIPYLAAAVTTVLFLVFVAWLRRRPRKR